MNLLAILFWAWIVTSCLIGSVILFVIVFILSGFYIMKLKERLKKMWAKAFGENTK